MKVILNSFRQAERYGGLKFSVARWQPKAYQYPELKFLAPFGLQHLEPDIYRTYYKNILKQYRVSLITFLEQHLDDTISLLCWCNPDRQKEYDKLFCHTILIGYEIEKLFHLDLIHPDKLETVYADGRDTSIWQREANM